MKAPHTPTQFRTPVRHYHRVRPAHSGDWDSWIGGDAKQRRKLIKKLRISAAIVAVLALTAGAVFLFGGF